MEKIVEVKGDRFFVKGCMNITLKSFCPCSSCGYWDGKKCEHPNPEGEFDMYQIIRGRWEIMKFEIPHEEIIIDTMAIPTNIEESIKLECKHCDLVVEGKIPKWKEGECPSGEIQHEFRVVREGE